MQSHAQISYFFASHLTQLCCDDFCGQHCRTLRRHDTQENRDALECTRRYPLDDSYYYKRHVVMLRCTRDKFIERD